MKLATTIGDFFNQTKTAAEAVRSFEGTGFRYLDYNFYHTIYKGSPFLEDNWMDAVHEAAEEAERLGFTFVQAHSPNYNPLDPKADHEAGMLATLRSIEACGYLGIPNLVVHSGYTMDLKYPQDKEAYFAKNKEFYAKLFPAMEKYNVNVLIENSAEGNMGGRYFFMTGQDMVDFIDYAGHPLLHACWDIGHANMRGANQYEEIMTLGKHLKAVHIQDNFGTFDEHMAPLMGTTDMDAVLQGLLDSEFGGYFTFEADNMLNAWNAWPHPRRDTEGLRPRKIAGPSAELRSKAEALLYEIGKFMLSQYGCFEE